MKLEFFNSKPSYALMSTISGHVQTACMMEFTVKNFDMTTETFTLECYQASQLNHIGREDVNELLSILGALTVPVLGYGV